MKEFGVMRYACRYCCLEWKAIRCYSIWWVIGNLIYETFLRAKKKIAKYYLVHIARFL